ncbi:FUSC family protein [Ideonella sp. BN130291]|uniref:FUSC family protein n=1 Tax=Ideonella sp. BN130291 TaxID=3112940 RepID=UPI002E262A6C|nr:FUSC family membrane protein [Ideonella sp. BN130291]
MPRLAPAPPAHVINGVAVALGIAAVQLLCSRLGVWVGEALAAQLAVAGAVCTSLADLPGTGRRNVQRVVGAAVLATLAALVVALLRPWPLGLGLGLAVLTWLAMMTLAWGPRAGPVSFAPVLSLVFTLAAPPQVPVLTLVGWHAGGALAYIGWSALANRLLQRRYRTLALAGAVAAMARLLRSRAEVLATPQAAASGELRNWVGDEATLAEALQAARDLLFAAPATERARRETAILLRTIDLRDVLLASRLDLDLLGDDLAGRWVRARVAVALTEVAAVLDAAESGLRTGTIPLPHGEAGADALAGSPLAPDDARQRLLPVLGSRVDMLAADARRVLALVRRDVEPQPLSLSADELQRFVGPETWPLAALRGHLRGGSPVLRHAVRAALALSCAYFIGLMLPWASHPHWLVLSVGVVLRGNLEQTLARRNARVTGTMLGCLLVLLLARVPALQPLAFLVAVGVAHAFITVRYLITAVAATVMALLQSHLVDPAGGFAIGERLADTLLGAALAWAFSYVLPAWERRSLPRAVAQALGALRAYAEQAVQGAAQAGVAQRLARLQAYDALTSIAAALQRSAAEPRSVRVPIDELTRLLDHAHRLMAHLSAIRMTRLRRAQTLEAEASRSALAAAHAELQARLQPPGEAQLPPEPPALRLDALPVLPPADEPMPWLLRRLQLAVHDAHAVGQCARHALERLGRR